MTMKATGSRLALLVLCATSCLLVSAAVQVGLADGSTPEATACDKRKRRKSTLKLIKETPFSGLFRDLRNSTTFEASGLAKVRGKYYVVFDNAFSLGYLDDRFQFRDPENRLIGPWEPESQFEGIAYVPENDTFLLLQEAIPHKSGDIFKPHIITARLAEDMSGWEAVSECEVNFELSHENKGFESIQYVLTPEGSFLLGLCEGNHCVGGSEGKDPGNGRIVVSELLWTENGGCVWQPVKVIEVPPSAFFTDYSAMAYNYQTQKLAILSQEEAAVWVGDFNSDALEFISDAGQVFHLPRDNHCDIVYCNAEGIQWIDNYRVVIASDKAKRYQPFWCDSKDQMIHIFSMPIAWDPYAPADVAVARDRQEEEADAAAVDEL